MILKIYSVFDTKAGAYIQPFYCVNRAVALRSFANAANDSQHDFFRHAMDFELCEIGEFDPSTGKITSYDHFECLGKAAQFINKDA